MYNHKCCCIRCLESKGYKAKRVDVLEKKGLKKATFENFDIGEMDWLAFIKQGHDTD